MKRNLAVIRFYITKCSNLSTNSGRTTKEA